MIESTYYLSHCVDSILALVAVRKFLIAMHYVLKKFSLVSS